MRLFWKINIYISIAAFSLFMLYFIIMYFEVSIPNVLVDIPGLMFFYSPFLEFIQIPICLIAVGINRKRQNKTVWMYIFMMFIFFF